MKKQENPRPFHLDLLVYSKIEFKYTLIYTSI